MSLKKEMLLIVSPQGEQDEAAETRALSMVELRGFV